MKISSPVLLINIITGVVFLIQTFLLLWIIAVFISLKKNNESADVFRDAMNALLDDPNYVEERAWIKSAFLNLGRRLPHDEINKLFRTRFLSKLNALRTFGNLGPAFGIMATFLGLYFVFRSNDPINKSFEIQGLSPVIIGSFFGIVVYAVSLVLYKKASDFIDDIVSKNTAVFYELDSKYDKIWLTKIEDLGDLYKKLYAPINLVINKFKTVSQNFDKFNTSIGISVDEFKEAAKNVAMTMEATSKSFIQNISSSAQRVQNGYTEFVTQGISYLAAELGKTIASVKSSIEESSSSFTQNIKSNIQIIQESFAKYLGESLNSLKDSLEILRTDANSSGSAIGQYSKGLEKIANKQNEALTIFQASAGIANTVLQNYESTAKMMAVFLEKSNNLIVDIDSLNRHSTSVTALAERLSDYSQKLERIISFYDKLSSSLDLSVKILIETKEKLSSVNQDGIRAMILVHEMVKNLPQNYLLDIRSYLSTLANRTSREAALASDQRANAKDLPPEIVNAFKNLPENFFSDIRNFLSTVAQRKGQEMPVLFDDDGLSQRIANIENLLARIEENTKKNVFYTQLTKRFGFLRKRSK